MSETKTSEQVRKWFDYTGQSIQGWARDHGFTPSLVYAVVHGKKRPRRGKTHEIAVLLGMKEGVILRAANQPAEAATPAAQATNTHKTEPRSQRQPAPAPRRKAA